MSETPITDMVSELMVAGATNEVILIAIRGAEMSAMSTRHPPDSRVDVCEQSAADKRREWDRNYRRNKRNSSASTRHPPDIHPNPPESTRHPLCPPLIEERKKEVSNKDSRRGTRCPPDWTPEQTDLNFAVCHLSEAAIENEVIKFRNYWTAKAGKDATKLNWGRTWQNWVLNAKERNHGNGQRRYQTTRDVGEELIAELRAKARVPTDAGGSDESGDPNAFGVPGNGQELFEGLSDGACGSALQLSAGSGRPGVFADPWDSAPAQGFSTNGRASG